MNQILSWYLKYNSNIVQGLFILIGVLLCVFIFRLFFLAKSASAEAAEAQLISATENIEKKINQILQAQTKTAPSTHPLSGSEDSAEIFEKMQAEIFNLKQALKEKESQPAAQPSTDTAAAAATATASAAPLSSKETEDYRQQIEDLKKRLSDYEVIAEDIADLQKLREENKKLQEQLSKASPSTEAAVAEIAPEPPQEKTPEVTNPSESVNGDLFFTDQGEVSIEEKDMIEQFQKSKGT
jgi:DNA repair exonuclease SbcCD ATPase subunit